MRRPSLKPRSVRRALALRPTAAALVLVGVAVLSAGCGSLGQRVNNFRAYYNTFYNAREAYDAGVEAAVRYDGVVDPSRYLSIFPAAAGGGGAPFEEAVEKSADLLRDRPDSDWADDALLLIGKAYFYQENYVGAADKFRETVVAAEAGGNLRLADEARFWLGRTLTAARRYVEAEELLTSALARPDVDRRWRPRMLLVLGELHVRQEAWPEAEAALRQGIELERDDDLAGRAQFLLAQALEAQGRAAEAAEAYRDVRSFNPRYELGYAAQMGYALALGLDGGDPETALRTLRNMGRDDKNRSHLAEISLARARVLAATGQTAEAEERLLALLYPDPDLALTQPPASGAVRGEIYLRYGELIRDAYNDLVRAAPYLDTAAVSLRAPAVTGEPLTRRAVAGVVEQAAVYRSYADLAGRIAEVDSLLVLGRLDDASFRARVEEIQAARVAEAREQQRLEAIARAEAEFGGSSTNRLVGGPGLGAEERPTTAAGASSSFGFLNYLNPALVQEGRLQFFQIWGERPLTDNWRRSRAIAASASATNPGDNPFQGTTDVTTTEILGLEPLDLSRVPRTGQAQAEYEAERAFLRYELGNVLFLSLQREDEARALYRQVIDEDFDVEVAVRALYALAELEREAGNASEAEALYRQVVEEEPDSDLAERARERLGMPQQQARASAAEQAARAAYERAYARWQGDPDRGAVTALLQIAAEHGETAAAPRGLLAGAVAYAELVRAVADSLGPVPEAPPEPRETLLTDEEPAVPTARIGVDAVPGDSLRVAPDPAVPEAPAFSEPDRTPEPVGADGIPARLDAPVPSGLVPEPLTRDSTGAPRAITGLDLFGLVVERYPATPFAQRAADLRATLETEPDTSEAAPSGPPVLDDQAVAEAVGDEPAEEVLPEGVPAEAFGLMGERPIAPEYGGVSWAIVSVPSPLATRALVGNYRRRGFRVAVYSDGTLYHILAGQFYTEAGAQAVRDDLPNGATPNIRIVSLEEVELLDEAELGG